MQESIAISQKQAFGQSRFEAQLKITKQITHTNFKKQQLSRSPIALHFHLVVRQVVVE